MITVYPLDATNYTAEALGAYNATRTRGVFSADNCFSVTTLGQRKILVSDGLAWLKMSKWWGLAFLMNEPVELSLDIANGILSRYVAIVLQLDKVALSGNLTLKYGELSANPTPLFPTQTGELVDELIVAQVLQRAGSVDVTAADITDFRLNEAYCGVMRDGVTGLPTASLNAQAQALINNLQAAIAGVVDSSEYMLKTQYDPIGNGINTTIQTYEHYPSGYESIDTLIGEGENGKFKATTSAEVTAFTINGVSCLVKNADATAIDIIAGNWYSFIFDGTAVNFNNGGAALHFKVIAVATESELQTNLRENTIAVLTDVPINSFYAAYELPNNSQNGDVVIINISRTTMLTFFAVKNKIQITPSQSYQYIGNAWVRKRALIFKNSTWVDIVEYFYLKGNEYLQTTGGWSTSGYTWSGSVSGATVKTPEYMHVTAGGHYTAAQIGTTNKIDLTNYKTLYAEVEITYITAPTIPRFLALPLKEVQGNKFAEVYGNPVAGKQVLTLDVQNVNELAYIALAKASGTITIYSVWGEYK